MKLSAEFKIITKKNGKYLLVFPNDPSIIWVKKPILDIFRFAHKFSKSKTIKKLSTRYKKNILIDAYKDISFLKKMGFLRYKNRTPWISLHYSYNIEPNSIWLNLTHRCNLNCPYCYSLDFRNRNIDLHSSDMKWATAKRIINWVFKINKGNYSNYITFVFFGGEPLLKLDILKRCLGYIKNKWKNNQSKVINLYIFTNATLINRNVAKLLKKYNMHTRITIHQKNREIFDKKMIRKIKMLKSLLPPSRFFINYIIKDIKDIKKILAEVKNPKALIQTFAFDFNLREKGILPVLKKMKNITDDLIKDKARKQLFVYGDLELEMLLGGVKVIENCGATQSTISFFPDGGIYPCSGPVGGNISGPLGNINNGGIDRKLYKNEIKKIKLKNRKKTDCMKCWIRSYCRGPCKYSKRLIPSIVKGKNLLCDAHKLFMEYFIKIFAELNVEDILNLMNQRNCGSEDMYKIQEKYEKTKLLFHLRDLRNKHLRYARLVTPALYES